MDNLPEQIKAMREKLGLTQSEMATALDISQQVLGNIEIGRTKNISAKVYKNFNKMLGNTTKVEKNSSADEKITALQAAVKILTLEVVQLKHEVTKESITTISLQLEKMMQLEARHLQG